jgi:hypothetical protein
VRAFLSREEGRKAGEKGSQDRKVRTRCCGQGIEAQPSCDQTSPLRGRLRCPMSQRKKAPSPSGGSCRLTPEEGMAVKAATSLLETPHVRPRGTSSEHGAVHSSRPPLCLGRHQLHAPGMAVSRRDSSGCLAQAVFDPSFCLIHGSVDERDASRSYRPFCMSPCPASTQNCEQRDWHRSSEMQRQLPPELMVRAIRSGPFLKCTLSASGIENVRAASEAVPLERR